MRRLRRATGVVAKEAKHLARTFARTFLVAGGAIALALFAWLMLSALLGERQDQLSLPVYVIACAVYGVMVGAQTGLVLAFVRVVWTMVGAMIVVPFVLVPLALYLSFWLCSGLLVSATHTLVDEFASQANHHEWLVGAVGRAAHAGPIVLVIALPLLALDLVQIMAHPGVAWALVKLLLGVGFAFLLGALPSAALSLIALVGVWVRRMKKRDALRGTTGAA